MPSSISCVLVRTHALDTQLKYAEEQRKKALSDYDALRTQLDASRSDVERLSGENEALSKAHLVLEQQVKELKTQRDEYRWAA